jgi:lysophospholipase L1-like esterase
MEVPHTMSNSNGGGAARSSRMRLGCLWAVFIGVPWIVLLFVAGEWYTRKSLDRQWESAKSYSLIRGEAQEKACDQAMKAYASRPFNTVPSFDDQVKEFALRDDAGRQAWADARHELAVVCDPGGNIKKVYLPANEPPLEPVAKALVADQNFANCLDPLYVERTITLTPEDLRQTMAQNRILNMTWPQQLRTGPGQDALFQLRLRPLDAVPEEHLGAFIRRSVWEAYGCRYRPRVDWTDGFEWSAPELLTRQFSTNSLGFRGAEVAVPKPGGVVRVVCIGSSMTVEGPIDELTYPHLLQDKLRAHFGTDRIEVVNAGNHGSVAANDLARAPDYLALQPDLVIHYGFGNDLRAMCIHDWNEPSRLKTRPGMLLKWCLRHSRLVFKYANWALVPSRSQMAPEYESHSLDSLRRLGRFFSEKGVDMMFCTVAGPATAALSARDREFFDYCVYKWLYNQYYLDSRGYERMLGAYNDKLKEMGPETGTSVIDVSAELSAHTGCFADIFHMNTAGLDRKAEIVFQQIKDRVARLLAAADPAAGSKGAPAHAE